MDTMEAIVAISITPHPPTQIAAQDLTGQPTGSAAANGSTAAGPQIAETGPSEADQIAAHAGLVAQANQALQGITSGASQPDLNGEGARLLALHLQQQLAGQSLSIANQAPQSLLALLR
jgi:flagellin